MSTVRLSERRDPAILNGSRRRRIARGSGTSVQEVNQLVKQFDQMRKMFAQVHQVQTGKRKMRSLPVPSAACPL